MTTPSFDVVVVGGGIVGLATAHAVARTGRSVAVVEREQQLANHQTGNNSNVIHSGLYYAPGGFKARLAVAGCAETVAFCREHDLPHEVCGKLVVATEPEELPRMAELKRRGDANGVENHELDQAGMREHEPHVRGIAALYVPSTGITDYRAIALKLGELVEKEGGEIHLGRAVTQIVRRGADVVVRTARGQDTAGDLLGTQVVVCGGLRCDELAVAAGADPGIRIIPFRGEYSGFSERAAALVKGLIYPVPDPAFPFLGVHATRGIDGHVHAGPNAVLALAREGYSWGTVKPKEFLSTITYPGMLRIAKQHWRYGFGEMHRSLSKKAMVRQIQRLLPDVQASDLSPAGAGVRAQAVKRDGTLVDDFLFVDQGSGPGSVLHVLNAPSPAATAALPIGREILERLTGERIAPLT